MISLQRKLALRAQASQIQGTARSIAALARTTQAAHSTVAVGDEDVSLVDTVQDARDSAELLPGLEDGTALAGDDAWIAWDQSEYAVSLAAELESELSAAKLELDRALEEAAEALADAGLARSEAAQAVADAQAAAAEAGTALSEAIAAAQAASDASVQAKLADGRLTMSDKAPVVADGAGKPVGAVWMRQVAGAVTALWEWTALGWVSRPLAEQIIPKVAIGEGTYGELAGGRIKARSITADRVLIAGGGNHIDNPSFLGGDGWALDSGVSIVADSTEGNYLSFTGTGSTGALNSAILDVEPGDEVLFEAEVWSPGGFTGNAGGLRAYRYTVDGQSVAMTVLNFSPSVTPQKAAASYVIPEGVCQIQFRFATAITGGEVRVRKPRVRVKSAGELIVDGSILAQHLAALTVTAEKLAANAVTAVKIAAGAVTAEKIMAGAVTTVKLDALAVTAAKIAAGAIIADKIAAGAITTAKLAATAIDGMTITGALIRTAPSGQRLELDVNGLRAFNASGAVVASLRADSGGLGLSGSLTSWAGGTSPRATLSNGTLVLDVPSKPGEEVLEVSPAGAYGNSKYAIAFGNQSTGLQSSTYIFGRLIRFAGPVEFQGDTDWTNISPPGATGTCQWKRVNGIVYLRFDLTLSTLLAPGTNRDPVFVVPSDATPGTPTPINVGGGLNLPAAGRVWTNGNVSIRNNHSGSENLYRGFGQWPL